VGFVLLRAPQLSGRGHGGAAENAPARNSGCGGPFVTPIGARCCTRYVYARTAVARTQLLQRKKIVDGHPRLCLFSSEGHKSARRAQNRFLTAGAFSTTLKYPVQYKASSQFRVFRVAACPPSSWCWWDSKCGFVPG